YLQVCRIHSPRAYRFIGRHFPVRSEQSIRYVEAKLPKLPMEICDDTFELQQKLLQGLRHIGPVGVACDDTKALSGLFLCRNNEGQSLLVGGINGPVVVHNPEEISNIIEDARNSPGTKLRLWTLQVPLPGVLPSIIAAIPIPESMDTEKLL
ncbi:hypothetical protein GGX14DRAFT_363176, partial [Mycena pura]